MRRSALIASTLLATSAAVQAFTLDFGNGPTAPTLCTVDNAGTGVQIGCGNYAYFSQAYGDVAGVVDVSYVDIGPMHAGSSLRWWDAAYNTLYGVL